jgi:hypothetical protein
MRNCVATHDAGREAPHEKLKPAPITLPGRAVSTERAQTANFRAEDGFYRNEDLVNQNEF